MIRLKSALAHWRVLGYGLLFSSARADPFEKEV